MIETMINVYDIMDWYLITAVVVFAVGILCSARGGKNVWLYSLGLWSAGDGFGIVHDMVINHSG